MVVWLELEERLMKAVEQALDEGQLSSAVSAINTLVRLKEREALKEEDWDPKQCSLSDLEARVIQKLEDLGYKEKIPDYWRN